MENNEIATTPVENATTYTVDVSKANITTSPVVSNEGGNEPEVKITKEDDNKVNYVKERVDRAKEQTTKNILKDLGVESLEEAKKLVNDGHEALKQVNELKAKLEAQEHEKELSDKKNLLIKLLDKENVFDSDALINYLDLDKVQVENGEVKDSEVIIDNLKKAKPNFFAKYETVSDSYVKGQVSKPMTAIDKQKSGDINGAINDYLKTILK